MTDKTMHEKIFAIEWGDMDALGHVNNGRYFDYFQQARIDWLADMGLGLSEDKGPVVLQLTCTFIKPIVYPAKLRLVSRLHSPGRSSIVLDHAIYQGETLMTEASSKLVWIDYKLGKSIPLPKEMTDLFS
ncbi:MAG: acyl-CoA thioesterase [Proteobacteria bacterium]|nr:acyl-CoA thioesterase [Pseudomonadota bacterium]